MEQKKSYRTALYARVSTVDQNPEMQLRDLQAHADREGWQIVDTYQDVISGAKANRPGLNSLMDAARARKFDCLLVWKLDRFGRSLVDCLNNIRSLEEHGVRLIAVTQGLDTDHRNPASRFLLHVLGAAAEFERALIRERSHAGLKRYRHDYAAGRVGKEVHSRSGKDLAPGRPRRVFDRLRIGDLRQRGLSPRQIARQMGLGEGTVRRVIRATAGTTGTRQNPTAGIP